MRSPRGMDVYKRFARTGRFSASPPIVLGGGFLLLIFIGTVLLALPIATTRPIGLFSAFFMSASAVTVTGLAVVDPATSFTWFGQVVLALLVQIGGLGFVTLAVVSMLALGKRISMQQQAVALEAFNQTSVSKIRQTAFTVFKLTAVIEGIAMVMLFIWWIPELGIARALYEAIFHSIMAFNNAGFTLRPTQAALSAVDPFIILLTTTLITLGGIGFTVLNDVRHKWRWTPLTPYTRIIVLAALVLNLGGFAMIWALEASNPLTLGSLSPWQQGFAAWMQSVTTRTAGFTSIDVGHLTDSSTLLIMLLMFIGGGSLSTASGIKIGTAVVLFAAAYSYIRQRSDIVVLKRTISADTVQKALAILLLASGLIFIGVFLLSLFEKRPLLDLAFEVVSAFTTTGLTRGLTSELSTASQTLLVALMFIGRLGPLTLVYNLSTQRRSRIRYPEAPFQVG